MINKDKYYGCFAGLACGDALAAPYEGGIIERLIWKFLGKTRSGKLRFTDDTQMSIDIANSIIIKGCVNQDEISQNFASSYHWSRGYGPATAHLLKSIKSGKNWRSQIRSKYPQGSFGNGAAMRSPIIALAFATDETLLLNNTILVSEITHAHELAIEGAKLIAYCTYLALWNTKSEDIIIKLAELAQIEIYQYKIDICRKLLFTEELPAKSHIQATLGNGMTASESCITAIFFALKFRNQPFHELIQNICQIGGDTDTIAAMAGAIWGAFNGIKSLDTLILNQIENIDEILNLAQSLYSINYE